MAKILTCPCGAQLVGRTDDEFVSTVDAHLKEAHEGRMYPADMILAMSKDVPDDQVPG
jgi:hypothetical protein